MIAQNTVAVFQTAGFLECDRSTLGQILKIPTLSCGETDVFDWCMAWVKAAGQAEKVTRQMVDQHLGDLFLSIPFGLMTIEEFSALLPSYGDPFSSDELRNIIQSIASNDNRSKSIKRKLQSLQWNKEQIVECDRRDYSNVKLYAIQDVETSTFSTNKPILLGGITLAALNEIRVTVTADLIMIEWSDSDPLPQIIHHQKIEFSFGSRTILLEKIILIKPNFNYEIQLKLNSPFDRKFHGYLLKAEVQLRNTDIVIKFQENPRRKANLIQALNFNLISDTSENYKKKRFN